MEPTSQQELKQLLEEGKITEDEYSQLLDALKEKPVKKDFTPPAKSRSGFGKAALILMVTGLILPVAAIVISIAFNMIFAARGIRAGMLLLFPFAILAIPCEILAFIFGIIGWKSTAGKIVAIGVPAMGIFIFLAGLILPVMFVGLHKVKAQAEHRYSESYQGYPLDSMEGVLTQDGVEFDKEISSDGKGSIKIRSEKDTVVRLFETGPIGAENRMLIYSAKLRSGELGGKAYLEMWCDIPGYGEFFSRAIDRPIAGTTEWTNMQTPFRLEAGQMPANVKLNLVIEGAGTVWIDDIKILLNPLD